MAEKQSSFRRVFTPITDMVHEMREHRMSKKEMRRHNRAISKRLRWGGTDNHPLRRQHFGTFSPIRRFVDRRGS